VFVKNFCFCFVEKQKFRLAPRHPICKDGSCAESSAAFPLSVAEIQAKQVVFSLLGNRKVLASRLMVRERWVCKVVCFFCNFFLGIKEKVNPDNFKKLWFTKEWRRGIIKSHIDATVFLPEKRRKLWEAPAAALEEKSEILEMRKIEYVEKVAFCSCAFSALRGTDLLRRGV